MKAKIINLKGKEKKKIDMPVQFTESYRPDLIKRAFNANQSKNYKNHGTDKLAGLRKSSDMSKRRRKYRGVYGRGRNRTPRKVMSRKGGRFNYQGAFAPHAKGGRAAHPPRTEKNIVKKINDKERKKAIRSAISSADNVFVEEKIDELKKLRDVKKLLLSTGLSKYLNSNKRIRSGRGKMRGRKYKKNKGILFVTVKYSNLFKSCRNLPGSDIINVRNLNVSLLAPGGISGRKSIWSEKAVKKMKEEKLFL